MKLKIAFTITSSLLLILVGFFIGVYKELRHEKKLLDATVDACAEAWLRDPHVSVKLPE